MTAPIIPAGAGADLADLLLQWRTVINAKIGGGVRIKTADTSRPNDAAFTSDPHLSVPVAANTRYAVLYHLVYQAGTTGQMKMRLTFPAGATFEAGTWGYEPGTFDWQAAAVLSGGSPYALVSGLVGGSANVPTLVTGALHVGSTAGTLDLQWGQTVSNGTATILRKGSWVQALAET